MRSRTLLIFCISAALSGLATRVAADQAEAPPKLNVLVGQDLHLRGREAVVWTLPGASGGQILVFQDGLSMVFGAHQLAGDRAVVWLENVGTESRGRTRTQYEARVYLEGNISAEKVKDVQPADVTQIEMEQGHVMALRFHVSGQVFATTDGRRVADPRASELYAKAFAAMRGWQPQAQLGDGFAPTIPKAYGFEDATQADCYHCESCGLMERDQADRWRDVLRRAV